MRLTQAQKMDDLIMAAQDYRNARTTSGTNIEPGDS